MKLFEISIVANNFFGASNSFLMIRCVLVSDEFNISFSLGLSEKKATSEPDINAENSNKTNNTIREIIVPTEIGLNISVNKINVK